MSTKPWYLSKTVWFNVITIVVGIIGQVTDAFTLNAQTLKVFGIVLSAGNVLLRFLTTSTLTASKTQ